MDREILFRGKRSDNGEWMEGSIIHQTDFYGDCVDRYFIVDGTETYDYDIGEPVEISKETVCQYTGLSDKKGRKIWENDRCRVGRACVLAYGIVQYFEGCFCFVEDKTENILRLCDVRTNGYEIEVLEGGES